MALSQAGIDLIKRWEGLRLDAYKCSAGVLTIGYGHTSAAGAPKVVAGMTITKQEAEDILKRDLEIYEDAVRLAITKPMNANQFAACVSLCYNIGPSNFKTSSVVKRFNSGDVAGAADSFLMWNKAGGEAVQGLVNRREDEKKLFLTPVLNVTTPETQKPDPGIAPPDDMVKYVTRAELVSLLRTAADIVGRDL